MKKRLKKSMILILIIILFSIIFYALLHKVINSKNDKENIEKQKVEDKISNEFIVTNELKQDNINFILSDNDLFVKYYSKADELLKNMTLEEKVSQMFLVRYPKSGVIKEIVNEKPGGYILFSRDFDGKSKEEMTKELGNCQKNSKIKLILCVDEEGGKVVRVSNHKAFRNSPFESPQMLWQKGKLDAILKDSNEKSLLLKGIGLNMNLTPVVDICENPASFIYERSYGKGVQETQIYAKELVKTMKADKMISSLKHFPGYGNNVDTHTKIAIDERPYVTFESSDFLPFKSGIEEGAPTILVSHNIVKCIDENNPASLSENIHRILRKNLGFSGIIMTDDLEMDAIKKYYKNEEVAIKAVLAGNDIIISSDFKNQKEEVIKAVNNGKIDENIINSAVKRVLALKCAYNII